jgi:hypothetical protein
MKFRWIILIAFLLLAGSLSLQPTAAQSSRELYFPETGHKVTGEFLDAYLAAENPLLLYGYPITEAFMDPVMGRMVQYFQRTRFELHPEMPLELRVKRTPLGAYTYEPAKAKVLPNPSEKSNACKYFPETGFPVCYAFLDFFEANGGVAQFGYPISNFEFHDDRIVQYFQLARMEWHPEFPAGQTVTLTDLGRYYFDLMDEKLERLSPVNNVLPTILELKVNAFTRQAVTAPQGQQTVSVIVQDQNWQAVHNAQVTMIVEMPDGQAFEYPMPETNGMGVSQFTFDFSAHSLGMAEISVQVSFQGLNQETKTHFRVWW